MAQNSKREHVIDVALRLFYQGGFTATGVDKISEESGVTKKTIYNHFKSKDELILAALRKRDELYRNQFMRSVSQISKDPHDQLLAIFDVAHDTFNDPAFFGCMFINASAEFTQQNHPCHMVSSEHIRLMMEFFKSIADKAGAQNPAELASQLSFLFEGAIVHAHVRGDTEAAHKAQNMARVFIDAALT